jgi:hypothetical protein
VPRAAEAQPEGEEAVQGCEAAMSCTRTLPPGVCAPLYVVTTFVCIELWCWWREAVIAD